eukprot:GHVT01002822.1.p3 GENE.GHVT01002822.1~~GHVT01002822.1.p3  ORF type:complete len:107 (+),score=16.22 GHVT01002822.1:797-1117(+)
MTQSFAPVCRCVHRLPPLPVPCGRRLTPCCLLAALPPLSSPLLADGRPAALSPSHLGYQERCAFRTGILGEFNPCNQPANVAVDADMFVKERSGWETGAATGVPLF